tara:strand:+ start:20713 stop:26313 length:5601 start_codon:yes stop_codon:yes gene_type:complete
MATCFNKNTAEYKALQGKYTNPIIIDSMISSWQKSNNSDLIPTIVQVDKYVSQKEALFSLKKKSYANSVLNNLKDAKLISMYEGDWYINRTVRDTPITIGKPFGRPEASRQIADLNKLKVQRLLDFWNIPQETVSIQRTKNTYRVSINDNMFTKKDVIAQDNNKDHTHVLDIIQHMSSLFPQLNIQVVSVKEAEEYYNTLTEEQTKGIKFNKINSYYVRGNVMIIKGRVTPETAIEEVLHPFVDAVYLEKNNLFNGLLSEAKKMFPQLDAEILSAYNDKRGFNQRDRDLELVTQALSRHFKSEYENEPTESWKSKISQLLKFLLDAIQDLSSFISGKRLKMGANALNSNNTLSSIAKLLNTSDLEFKFTKDSVIDRKAKFSLTPELKNAVKEYKSQTNTAIQDEIIDKLFHAAVENKEQKFQDFTVGSTLTGTDTQLVVLDKESHTYINIETGELYGSVTTKIKGGMKDPENIYKINRDIGNDFDAIMEHITMLSPKANVIADDLLPKMIVLKKEEVQKAIDQIQTILNMYRNSGAVIIPQVVISDGSSETAGTIDLLAINKDGSLQIIDLKVSKNSVQEDLYDKPYPVNEGSVFYDSTLSDKDQLKMSTRMQQSMQVNTYRRILVNMGYNVDFTGKTIHFHVDVTGKGKKQKFKGTFRLDGEINHPSSQNASKINDIVPLNQDIQHKESMKEEPYVNEEEAKPQDDVVDDLTYQGLTSTTRAYKEKLVTRRDALEMLQDREKQSFETERMINLIDRAISDINASMLSGTVDVVYEELLQQSIDEMDNFIDFVNDPVNINSIEYIDKVMNMESVINMYKGLDVVPLPDGVSLGHKKESLRNTLKNKILEINGSTDKQDGLINEGIYNYVRTIYVENTNRTDLTDNEIDKIMNEMVDTNVIDFGTSDLATSRDPLSQLMDKLYKRHVQKSLDAIDNRNDQIRRLASKLEALSPGGKVDYKYMLVFDKEGKFTGKTVQKIGYQYDAQWKDARQKLYEADGTTWREYILKDNVEDYTKEELAQNIELALARREYGKFMSAEDKVNGVRDDGDFHKYTDEYKGAREQVAVWISSGKRGYWKKKASVTQRRYDAFTAKYHQTNAVQYANETNGELDGTITVTTKDNIVKRDYIEKRERSSNRTGAQNMLDQKYIDLMNPSPTSALAQAQKEFYLMWQKFFEEDLLSKLPKSQQAQMAGRSPLVRDNTLKAVKREGNIVTGLWGKTTRGMKDLFTKTSRQEVVNVDENGYFIDTLPIFYVGRPQTEEALVNIENEIQALQKSWNDKKIKADAYKQKLAELRGKRNAIQSQPLAHEMSLDMADNLLRFSTMAENYEVMNEIKNTLNAFMKVIDNRKYSPDGISKLYTKVGGKEVSVGMGRDSNIAKRARKWMHMVYYDNEKKAEGFADKISKNLISLSSLTYVGFNIWGNINNYAVGRINNAIETIGGRYFEPEAMLRATKTFQGAAMEDIMKKMGDSSTWAGITGGKGKYNKIIPGSKYNGLVNYFRMMDDKADIRESGKTGANKKLIDFSWAYMFQDGAEYNVQTKVGIAILMSTKVQKVDKDGTVLDEMSLYDAYQYNNKTGEVTLKDGYDTLVKRNGVKVKMDMTQKADIRNNIREVNKQIHGNYADVDRAVIQEHWLGNLGMQFHKWVAPAFKARYRNEYYDENLGWVEGRYKSALSFMGFFYKEMFNVNKTIKRLEYEFGDERAATKITGMKRTLAEIGLMFASFVTATVLQSLFDDDEDGDKSIMRRRFENALIYQFNRQGRELQFFYPVVGFKEQFYMAKSPIAVTRTLGEMGDAFWKTIGTGLALGQGIVNEDYNIKSDSDVYYQRGYRKGQLKLAKEWADIIPLLYTINRYRAYDTMTDFYVK